ncbi:hypothetical protein [Bizionia arctica]|uniref:DUF3300 domain-containing protein n=1 Tax=Bizionia arctica TaxID=1495645 RepID=A0A917LNI8_9FLAO|nr:hypothetical protein [Bizionia arctica]GGG45651.1 hypothetical protein GCM10010976_16530 [Bizionia arctica]
MKKIMFLITGLILGGFSVSATTTNKPNQIDNSTTYKGYGNSFIFVENNIEFSVFPDGQFDFYMPSYASNVNVYSPGISISFNSGYNYNPFLQYDEYGAIIQVEHVPVYYDFYGRVTQIGNVFINYNAYGNVSRIGGLYIHYNNYRNYSYYTGYINAYNPYYVYRPWHAYYSIPAYNQCVVYNRPYRQNYNPVRYTYSKPYTNNYRRTTSVASRNGNSISRQSNLATRSTSVSNAPRRDVATSNLRSTTNTIQPRESSQEFLPRTNNQIVASPRNTTSTIKPSTASQMSTSRANTQVTSQPKTPSKSERVEKNNSSERKPNTTNNRTYSNENSNEQVVSNTRSRS